LWERRQQVLARRRRLCYIITTSPIIGFDTGVAPSHHHHHHRPGEGHPPATIGTSILRMSVPQRLVVAAVLIAALWGVVGWAMT
jgi:hypothetical protein